MNTSSHSSDEEFRGRLVALEEEVALLRQEKQQLRAGWDGEKRRTRDLEKRLVNAEAANTSLQRRVEAFCEAKNVLENEVDDFDVYHSECPIAMSFLCSSTRKSWS